MMGRLGAYPTDSYYDPTRPSWLPYWIDTASEEALKLGMYPGVTTLAPLPKPPGAAAPGAPQTQTQMTVPGAYTPADSATAAHQTSLAEWNKFFTQVADDEAARQAQSTGFPIWAVVAVGVGAFLLLGGRR